MSFNFYVNTDGKLVVDGIIVADSFLNGTLPVSGITDTVSGICYVNGIAVSAEA